MHWIRDLPIRYRVTLVIWLTSTSALLLASLGALWHEFVRFRLVTVQELAGHAQLMSEAAATVLLAHDAQQAREMLCTLHTQNEVVFARIFAADSRLLAEYVRPGVKLPATAATWREGCRFEGNLVYYLHPVISGDRRLGTVFLCADRQEVLARFKGDVGIVVVVMVASLLASLVLATRLQRIVSDPIVELADVARAVAARKDYSLRAAKPGSDEVGLLTESFYTMLAEIQKRDSDLRDSEQQFRQLAESIREVFWITTPDKSRLLYISPGYEEIWCRTCASLYASPSDWVEAIHLEDRDRVLRATRTKQATGEYDEEYRILRPGGEVRWIRDRAFPVRDATGKVYRIVGIAEDITAHKRLERKILEISDREQARIGQDLHDGLCQVLVGIGFSVDLLRKDLAGRSAAEDAALERMAAQLKAATGLARRLVQGLYPVNLESQGLAAALQDLAAAATRDFGIACEVDCGSGMTVGNPGVATHIYRIAQEAVHNAVKHGSPRKIKVQLINDGEETVLRVADDGVGIAMTVPASPGMGLSIMRYRAGILGGTLEVRRGEAGGTILTCHFPRGVLIDSNCHGNQDGPPKPSSCQQL